MKFVLVYAGCWLVFFQIARLFFLLYHVNQSRILPTTLAVQTFVYGLRMDASMTAYLTLPVCLFLFLSIWLPVFSKQVIYRWYSAILLLLVLLITTADAELYRQWGFRIDASPLKYLQSPSEAWASVSHLPLWLMLLSFCISYFMLVTCFFKVLTRACHWLQEQSAKVPAAVAVILISCLAIIPLRGGLQQTPMNQSMVYFSSVNFANHAALNATWNFLQGVLAYNNIATNPYVYLSGKRAKEIKDSLYQSSGTTAQVLNNTTPNVILIIWESFTGKALDQSIKGKEIVPSFQKLQQEGLYFSQVYASGDRTDKGLSAILSGYPALPATSILRDANKAARLPSLSNVFKNRGYAVPFFYGGEPEFANIKSYLLQAGFSPLTEKKNFRARDQNSKWGAHDGVVAQKIKEDLNHTRQPFFATWLTLTSHEPFETPLEPVIVGNDETTLFLNSLHYTDSVVGDFVAFCKQQPWWKNTLLIIIADHGHPLPATPTKSDNFKIPMLWVGGALKVQGLVTTVMSQTDLAATLLAQTSHAPTLFPFSKNIFDPLSKNWAFFSFKDGWGFTQPKTELLFDNVGGRLLQQKGGYTNADLQAGKALQQYIYNDYLTK
ncbi:MAG: LTA synthase family protein [Chitinophagaceae bacterium]